MPGRPPTSRSQCLYSVRGPWHFGIRRTRDGYAEDRGRAATAGNATAWSARAYADLLFVGSRMVQTHTISFFSQARRRQSPEYLRPRGSLRTRVRPRPIVLVLIVEMPVRIEW
jgi:hypothetical protein